MGGCVIARRAAVRTAPDGIRLRALVHTPRQRRCTFQTIFTARFAKSRVCNRPGAVQLVETNVILRERSGAAAEPAIFIYAPHVAPIAVDYAATDRVCD